MRIRKKDKNKLIAVCCILAAVVILAVFGEAFCGHDPYLVQMGDVLKPPGTDGFLFGTDMLGRCIACRVISGLKYSLSAGLLIVLITGAAGTLIGVTGAWFSGIPDKILLYLNVVFQSFPGFVLAIFIAGLLGQGLMNGVLALSITGWTRYARLSRSLSFEVIHSDYVKAARISGLGFFRVLVRHILPNMMIPLLVNMALSVSDAIVSIAGLSFLGIGAAPPTPEWGTMIADSRSYFQIAPWTILAPGIALLLLVILFNVFADVLQKVLDPRETVVSRRQKVKQFFKNKTGGKKNEKENDHAAYGSNTDS